MTKAAAQATGLTPGLPIALGCADTAAAAFALGLSKQGDAFESAGTSDVLTFCLEEPDFDAAFLNRAHVLPGRWLAHGAMSTTGGAVEWLCSKAFPELASAAEVEAQAARSVPGAHGVVFLPYLAGERSPVFDPAARGLWLGLRRDTTRADLVRAVYEGIAFGLRQILNQAERHWNFSVESVPCVGGGAMSSLGLRVRADVLGLTCRSVAFPHVAALGAALLGGIAAGVFSGPEDPALPFLRTSTAAVHPDPQNKTVYDQLFQVYDRLYPALVEAMHALP
ncbi:MAG TPA: hypothetical protein GX511_01715 [Firmicutes bacterium]|nr:hypothetical protein [Bacillota bacterium]